VIDDATATDYKFQHAQSATGAQVAPQGVAHKIGDGPLTDNATGASGGIETAQEEFNSAEPKEYSVGGMADGVIAEPEFVCGCGKTAGSLAGLKSHQRNCEVAKASEGIDNE
jgi:hypothetical protein